MTEPAITADDVRDFFVRVLDGDTATLQDVAATDDEIGLESGGLVFTLPALHALLDPDAALDFGAFRRLLYDSTLNEELGAFDAEVVVHRSTGKTDTSHYCLRRRRAP